MPRQLFHARTRIIQTADYVIILQEDACHEGERSADAMIREAPDTPGDNNP